MNGKMKLIKTGIVVTSLVLVGLIMVNGCKKEEPAASPGSGEVAAAVTIEQKTCPVMGGAINTKYFTEYKGKKVYFCCPGCKEKFEGNPEQYIAKLPQFSQ